MCVLAKPSLSRIHNPCPTFSRTAQLEKPVFVAMVKIEGIMGEKPLAATALYVLSHTHTHRDLCRWIEEHSVLRTMSSSQATSHVIEKLKNP